MSTDNHDAVTVHLDPSAPTATPPTPTAPAGPTAPTEHEAMIASIAAEQLASLTADQRSAVVGLAGADPVAQINAIRKLQPTWNRGPKDTALRPGAPREVVFGQQQDHESVYRDLMQTNPVLASRYLLANLPNGGR